jgi:shikimate dehydrogenase
MQPRDFEIPPIPLKALRKGQIVYDLVYRPVETRLLAAAKDAGAEALNGVGMLVHQGAAALKKWTGVEAPIVVMERAVLQGPDGIG